MVGDQRRRSRQGDLLSLTMLGTAISGSASHEANSPARQIALIGFSLRRRRRAVRPRGVLSPISK
jgi:hypothetical protein